MKETWQGRKVIFIPKIVNAENKQHPSYRSHYYCTMYMCAISPRSYLSVFLSQTNEERMMLYIDEILLTM